MSGYLAAGVNDEAMGTFKGRCMAGARRTVRNSEALGFKEESWSRGGSAYVARLPRGGYIGFVIEGLGTKFLATQGMVAAVREKHDIASTMHHLVGRVFDGAIAQDTFAMVVNDLTTTGVRPAQFALKVDVENEEWLTDAARAQAFVDGIVDACNMAGCTWVGGETAMLPNTFLESAGVFSGAAVGYADTEDELIRPDRLEAGDRIILIPSSGVGANGLSTCRRIATKLQNGWLSHLPDGTTYGEAVLTPTYVYAPMIHALQRAGIQPTFVTNITGQGFRKLNRAPQDLTCVIERLPERQVLFDLLQAYGGKNFETIGHKEMLETFNCGAGYAVFVRPRQADLAISTIFDQSGLESVNAGFVRPGPKKVIIQPLNDLELSPLNLG